MRQRAMFCPQCGNPIAKHQTTATCHCADSGPAHNHRDDPNAVTAPTAPTQAINPPTPHHAAQELPKTCANAWRRFDTSRASLSIRQRTIRVLRFLLVAAVLFLLFLIVLVILSKVIG